MNSKQLEYAVKLSESESFSQLAEKLKITQPALSKQILSLEKELGVQLFDRSATPIALTAAGEHFVRSAKEILYKEDELARSMEQFTSGERGQIVIGVTPFRSAYLIPDIVKKVRERFPLVQIKLVEEGSDLLRKDAVDGRFDFAVVNLPVPEGVLDVKPIEADRLALVVPSELCESFPHLVGKDRISFSECRDIPFAVVGATQEMRVLFDRLCSAAGFAPSIAVEVVSLTTAYEMARAGACATLLPMQFLNGVRRGDDVTVIELSDETYLRQPAVVVKRGQYISEYAKYAIDLLVK